jgi:hypothetical protein
VLLDKKDKYFFLVLKHTACVDSAKKWICRIGFAELDLPNRHNAEIVLSIRQNLPNSSLLTLNLVAVHCSVFTSQSHIGSSNQPQWRENICRIVDTL